MTSVAPRLTVRPLSGPDELDLFRRLSYVSDHELADDLATGRRVPERGAIGVRLLETATAAVLPAGARRPEYGRFVPPDRPRTRQLRTGVHHGLGHAPLSPAAEPVR